MKAVLFDLDGTIADCENTRFEIFKRVAQEQGLGNVFDDYTPEDFVNKTTKNSFRKVLGEVSDEEINTLAAEKQRLFREEPERYVKPVPGMTEVVRKLNKDYTLGVATSSVQWQVEHVLKNLGIYGCFNAIISKSDVKNIKPHPEIYLKLMDVLNMKPVDCIVVEDGLVGVQSAISAGIKVIAITTSFDREKLKDADFIIDRSEEILDIVAKL